MREIPLTRGQVALVDDEDFEALSQFKWQAYWSKFTQSFYARRTVPRINGRQATVYMHRDIMGCVPGDGIFVDHRDTGQTLNNQRSNLRVATRAENNRNQRLRRDSGTGCKCVRLHKRTGKYEAYLKVDGKLKSFGYRDTPEEAGLLVLEAAVQNYGEFARV